MAENNKSVEIYPRRKAVDAEQLAKALLSLVDRLSAEDKAHFVAEGEAVLKQLPKPSKGAAA